MLVSVIVWPSRMCLGVCKVPGPLHKGGKKAYLFIIVEYRARMINDQAVPQTDIGKLRSCLLKLELCFTAWTNVAEVLHIL